MPLPKESLERAKVAASKIDADVYYYNGRIEPPRDLSCIEAISAAAPGEKQPKAVLFLVTDGGSADVGYKFTRYIQERYHFFTVVVSGRCKSAGTLIAVGANELAFTPFGELGPLDIQLSKIDKFDQLQSGLTIQDSLNTLEARALSKFYEIVRDYIQSNNGQLSFASASKAASDFVTQLYAPVFARIDPEEVGARSRSMRIASDYGRRLAVKSQNLKPDTLRLLAETYSSHSFVIDQQEAETLFVRVRRTSDEEDAVVAALGWYARFEVPNPADFVFEALSARSKQPTTTTGVEHGAAQQGGDSPKNGGNPQRPGGTPDAASSQQQPQRNRTRTRAKNGGRSADEPPSAGGS